MLHLCSRSGKQFKVTDSPKQWRTSPKRSRSITAAVALSRAGGKLPGKREGGELVAGRMLQEA